MAATRLFTVRIPVSDYEFLEDEAALKRMPLSAFARERILRQAHWEADLARLRREILEALAADRYRASVERNSSTDAVMLEALMLLRRSAPPQTVAQVQGELRSRGLTPFQLNEGP